MDAAFCFYYLAATVTVLLLSFASRRGFSWKKARSNRWQHPPSPPSRLPIIGHLHLLKRGEPLHRTLAHLCTKHESPVIFLSLGCRPVLVVSSPAVAQECLSTHDLAFAGRPRTASTKYLGYDHTSLVFAEYGPFWRSLRSLTATKVFSNPRLGEYSIARSEEVRSFIASLARGDRGASPAADSRTPRPPPEFRKVTLRPLLFRLVFNIIFQMTVGKMYDTEVVEGGDRLDMFLKVVEEGILLLECTTNVTDFVPALRWLGFTEVENRLKVLRKKADEFLQPMIDERRRERKKKLDEVRCDGGMNHHGRYCPERRCETTMDVLLSLQQDDSEYYTDDIIKSLVVTLLAAGSETTAVTIEWVMSVLLNHPDVLSALDTEIGSVVGVERLVDESDLPRLPYLHAVINETLRLYPALPLLVPHYAREDCTVGGFHVSRGTILLINAWAIHRSAEVWDDPLEIRPERFLGGGSNAKTLAFGSGRRSCPGKGMAMRIAGLAVAALVQCLDWQRVGKEKVDMQDGMGFSMPKAVPLEALYRPREAIGKFI